MKPETAQLREKRVALVGELRKFHTEIVDDKGEPRDYTAEETQEFERREAELAGLEVRIERAERLETMERSADERRLAEIHAAEGSTTRRNGSSASEGEATGLAIQGWVRARRGLDLNDEHRESMERFGIRAQQDEVEIRLLNNRELRLVPPQCGRPIHRRALEARMTTGAATGGELIPEGFVRNWEIALLAISQMRNFCEVFRTASGNDLPWPTTDDTSNTGELLAEEGGAATQDVATGSVIFQAFKYSSKIVKVSAELLQDSAFNMADKLGELLGTRIARITNTHFTTGTGSSQPKGIVTAGTQAFVMASASAIGAAEVMRMPYEVDPEYMSDASAAWMMHQAIVKQIRMLRDEIGGAGTGQFLWQPGLIAGEPDTLAGFPICFNQAMASALAVNAKIMIFGALAKYKIRDVATMRLFHLKELYRANDQEGFIGFARHDGDLLDAGTNPVKYAQMAAS